MEQLLKLCRDLSATAQIEFRPEFDAYHISVTRKYLGKNYSYDHMVLENMLMQSKLSPIDGILCDIREALSNEQLFARYRKEMEMIDSRK